MTSYSKFWSFFVLKLAKSSSNPVISLSRILISFSILSLVVLNNSNSFSHEFCINSALLMVNLYKSISINKSLKEDSLKLLVDFT